VSPDSPAAIELRELTRHFGERTALHKVSITVPAGATLAVLGRNGAGKSTLLRHAAGLLEPTRGKLEHAGRVALLLQNPGDYLIHERVEQEASPEALAAVGLAQFAARNPRDLSGGERQRLALAIVSDGERPAVLALDEPTRGMDREAKLELAGELRRRAREGQAVIVATHDPEFAATCADRALLLADGRVIADGSTAELLSGGWYFATETARILGGAGGALLPAEGAALLRRDAHVELAS
jgi:energy-coupling factor transport system ATP-binding protein